MRPSSQDLIFGVNVVGEMLRGMSSEIIEVLLPEGGAREPVRKIRAAARERNIPVISVSGKVLDRLVPGQRHQGVVARVKPYRYLNFSEILQRAGSHDVQRIFVLDGVTDPRNFGALIRTADAAGVGYVVIPKDRSVDVTPVVVKASAGATSHVGIAKVTNLRRALIELKKQGFWIVGLDTASRQTIYQTSFPAKVAILLGGEGSGVRPINLEECDFVVSIPMRGGVSSLNVSVAGAVFVYELLRQSLTLER